MSREVIIKIRDDLDRSDADETISFSYRGTSYEIDLSAANVEVFDKSMDQFITVARKVVAPLTGGRSLTHVPVVKRAVLTQRREIRAWGNANGFAVRPQGMISAEVLDAYLAAHPEVKLHPGTPNRYQRQGTGASALTAQAWRAAGGGEEAEVPASALMSPPQDRTARDRRGERLSKPKREEIRAWAVAHGIDQAPTGMIKQAALEAYYAAHPEQE